MGDVRCRRGGKSLLNIRESTVSEALYQLLLDIIDGIRYNRVRVVLVGVQRIRHRFSFLLG